MEKLKILSIGAFSHVYKMIAKREDCFRPKLENDLILPHQPYHDEFLQTMAKLFKWTRFVGVVGLERCVWRLWGFSLLSIFITIEGGAVWKVIRALVGWATDVDGQRSLTARMSGAMFYAAALLGFIQSWRLSNTWNEIQKYWASVEWSLSIKYVPTATTLKRRMYRTIGLVVVCTILEHTLSVLSYVDYHCQPSQCIRNYILASHGFLLLESEYSNWFGFPLIFMVIIARVLRNMQDLIIILTSMGLTSRYQRLNECVAKVAARNNQEKVLCEDAEFLKVYLWRKIREAYVKQSMLVRKVNKSLGWLIVLSTFFNFYFICLQLYLGITQNMAKTPQKGLFYTMSFIWLSIRTIYTVVAAADVSKHSTLALPYLYECHAHFYNIEIERLQKQLVKDYVALSGMGFFYINRTVMLKMSGAVVTYVLVLVQYDDSDQNINDI